MGGGDAVDPSELPSGPQADRGRRSQGVTRELLRLPVDLELTDLDTRAVVPSGGDRRLTLEVMWDLYTLFCCATPQDHAEQVADVWCRTLLSAAQRGP